MNSSRDTLTAFTDAAADAVARAIAEVRREAARERESFAAEMRAVRAEWESRLASVSEVERRLADRLASLKDGEPGRDGRDGKDGVDGRNGAPGEKGDVGERGETGPAGADGADGSSVTIDDVRPMVEALVAEAVAAIPPPKDGRDGIDGKDGERGLKGEKGDTGEKGDRGDPGPAGIDGKDGAAGERGPEGPPGKLPMIAAWDDRVHYEGEAVTWRGGVYQALRDTGKEPGGDDWRCIVERGQDGSDGRSFQVQSTWQDGETYRALDVVALNGASFAAKRDNPGPCPGDGWQMLAMQGKAGRPGPKGDKGDRGLAVTASVVGGHITDDGVIVIKNADGSEARIDAYPILSKLGG